MHILFSLLFGASLLSALSRFESTILNIEVGLYETVLVFKCNFK